MKFARSFLILAVSTPLAFAPAVAGATGIGQTCKKVGSVAVVKVSGQATKVQCIKVGKNLKWQQVSSSSKTDSSVTAASALAPTENCRIADITPGVISSGFPRPDGYPSTLKKLRVLVLPVSFTDLPFTASDLNYVKSKYKDANSYYVATSYGAASFEAVYADSANWANAGGSLSENGLTNSNLQFDRSSFFRRLISEYEAKSSTAGYDIVEIVTSSSGQFGGATGMPPGSSMYGTGRSFGGILSTGGAAFSWNTLAHELGHAWLALEDLYFFQTDGQISAGYPVIGAWDLMGISSGNQKELGGWNRWLAGWIVSTSIRCVEKGATTRHLLEPLSTKQTSAGSKMMVYKLSDHSVVIAEYRAESAYNEAQSKLLVYRVDTSFGHGQGPVRYIADLGKAGTSVIVDSVKISLQKIDKAGVLIEVSSAG